MSTVASADDDESDSSKTLNILVGLGVLFFAIALVGGLGVVILLFFPDSGWATAATDLLQPTAESQGQTTSRNNTLDLLVKIISTAGSLAMSLALAAIYLGQNRILGEQTTIQDQQSKYMRQQRLPLLGAHESGIRLHENRPIQAESTETAKFNVEEVEDDVPWASVGVENHGDEVAEQIHLVCLIYFPDIDDEPPLVPGICAMESTQMITEPPFGDGALVPPDSGITLLRVQPRFAQPTVNGRDDTPFKGKLVEHLLAKENRVRFGFVLIYTNSMDQAFQVKLKSAYSAKPESFDDLEESEMSITTITERSGEYRIEDLVNDVEWEIPTDVFTPRG